MRGEKVTRRDIMWDEGKEGKSCDVMQRKAMTCELMLHEMA